MADTDYLSLAAKASISATDSLQLMNAAGVPFRSTCALPAVDAAGNLTISSANATLRLSAGSYGASYNTQLIASSTAEGFLQLGNNSINSIVAGNTAAGGFLRFIVNNSTNAPTINGLEAARFDVSGNLLVGYPIGTCHQIVKGTAENDQILYVSGQNHGCVRFYSANYATFNAAAAAMKVNQNFTTGRSINAAGTFNASGADYAEYVRKADGCGDIAKGDVCGVDRNGQLTRSWADAISFVVKSTDPSYVGGDSWALELGPRPEPPAPIAPEPALPIAPQPPKFLGRWLERAEGQGDKEFADAEAAFAAAVEAERLVFDDYRRCADAYPAAHAAWLAERNAYQAALGDYEVAAPAYEKELEKARQTVDRIAFSGQVPVNVDDETREACEAALEERMPIYLVAAANGRGVKAIAVAAPNFFTSWEHQSRRLGKVWAVRDGRPIIDVQHG